MNIILKSLHKILNKIQFQGLAEDQKALSSNKLCARFLFVMLAIPITKCPSSKETVGFSQH